MLEGGMLQVHCLLVALRLAFWRKHHYVIMVSAIEIQSYTLPRRKTAAYRSSRIGLDSAAAYHRGKLERMGTHNPQLHGRRSG